MFWIIPIGGWADLSGGSVEIQGASERFWKILDLQRLVSLLYMCELNVKNINLIGLFSTFTFIITLETQVEVSLLWDCQASEQLIQPMHFVHYVILQELLPFFSSGLHSFFFFLSPKIFNYYICDCTWNQQAKHQHYFRISRSNKYKAQLHFGLVSLTVLFQLKLCSLSVLLLYM